HKSYRTLQDLHSFPTRRSSDLKRKRRAWSEVVATGDSFAIKAHAKLDLQLWTEYNPVEHKHTVFAVADIRRIGALKSDAGPEIADRKSTRLNSSHVSISYAVFC